MTGKTISDVIGNISNRHIEEAADFRVEKKTRKFRWGKFVVFAACVCLVLAGIFPLFHNQTGGSPFVLTAYALENDNSVSVSTIREGESAPVSLFESKNGLKGFVFSYVINESWHPSAVSIIPENKFFEYFDKLSGLSMENGRHYYYFIPEQSETAPYNFILSHTDTNNNIIYEFHISIDEAENGYYAVIESVKTSER